MKEVTYKDWQKNPTSRMMWVWDDDYEDKVKRKVVYITKDSFPVLTISEDDTGCTCFQHCVEIEKPRRMTNKELSRWLREKPTREIKYCSNTICCFYTYIEEDSEQETVKGILIREDYGEWREPLVEE